MCVRLACHLEKEFGNCQIQVSSRRHGCTKVIMKLQKEDIKHWFVQCSFTRILLSMLVVLVTLFLIKYCFLHGPNLLAEAADVHDKDQDRTALHPKHRQDLIFKGHDRHDLIKRDLSGGSSRNENNPNSPASKDDVPYLEIMRDKPKISFSITSTLDKLMAEERLKHNQVKSEGDPPILPNVAGGVPMIGQVGLSQLKASLKDPGFVQKIQNLEDRRQDLYMKLLTNRGQLVASKDGGSVIVSYPQTPVTFPNNLKKSLDSWSKREKMWLNLTHFPWPTDPECKKFSVNFGKNLPIVGLASYPSSGNTWLRYLIQGISGYYTGSMYNDLVLRKKGLYGEGVPHDGNIVLTVKTHGHTTENGVLLPREQQILRNHVNEVNNTAILLIRNPFEAIIGHRHLDQGGHTGYAKPEEFQGDGWNDFVKIKTSSWLNFYRDWLLSVPPENLLVLHYENLKLSTGHYLRKIVNFLGLEEDRARIDCTLHFQKGEFKRDHNQTTIDPFTQEQKELIGRAIRQLDASLADQSKERLPTHRYQFL